MPKLTERSHARFGASDWSPESAQALQGLVMLERDSRKVVLLTSRVSSDDPLDPGSPIDYINDVAVASSGLIYFTDSVRGIMPRRNREGFWDTMEAYLLTLFQAGSTSPSPKSLRLKVMLEYQKSSNDDHETVRRKNGGVEACAMAPLLCYQIGICVSVQKSSQ